MNVNEPEIGKTIDAAGIQTNYHDAGDGEPVVLLHGSGPGVSAWSNWSRIIPRLSETYRVLAPDIVGFGFTDRPADANYHIKLWVGHLIGFLDALDLKRVTLVGNSFGGGLSLAASLRHGDRISRMILMGTPAGEFEQTDLLRAGMAFQPSVENMATILKKFPYDPSIVTRELVEARYDASLRQGGQEAFKKLMPPPPPPGQNPIVRGVPEDQLSNIDIPTLALHGREDRAVPPECGFKIAQNVPNADLHLFGQCGHWVQLEKEDAFVDTVLTFMRTR